MQIPKKSVPVGRGSRKRRAHTKSRRGCGNCKLRRVKCDETRPQCQNCLQYSVACNYTPGPDLQVAWQEAQGMQASQTVLVFNATPAPRTINVSIMVGEGYGAFQLNLESQARLYRFYHRTLPTISTPRITEVYQEYTTGLALAHPFLMHIILTIAITHDRHLLTPFTSTHQLATPQESHLIQAESQHRAQAANLLNSKLSRPIRPQDRDALWAAAAMLGISVLTATEAPSVQDSWPLRTETNTNTGTNHPKTRTKTTPELQWMDFSINKKVIWNVTDPLREDSIFHVLADSYRELMLQPQLCSAEEVAGEFVVLCGLGEAGASSFPAFGTDANPYSKAICMLTRMRGSGGGVASSPEMLCAEGVMPRDLAFIGFMEAGFKALLGERDARALLILAFWYAPLCEGVWWIARRAWIECRAICLYLERWCGGDESVRRLLGVVRARCGLKLDDRMGA